MVPETKTAHVAQRNLIIPKKQLQIMNNIVEILNVKAGEPIRENSYEFFSFVQ